MFGAPSFLVVNQFVWFQPETPASSKHEQTVENRGSDSEQNIRFVSKKQGFALEPILNPYLTHLNVTTAMIFVWVWKTSGLPEVLSRTFKVKMFETCSLSGRYHWPWLQIVETFPSTVFLAKFYIPIAKFYFFCPFYQFRHFFSWFTDSDRFLLTDSDRIFVVNVVPRWR